MTSVWLVTNGGSGEDGDEWLLDSIYATEEGAAAGKTKWFTEVEEFPLRGSILTPEEQEAIETAVGLLEPSHIAAALRSLLERLK